MKKLDSQISAPRNNMPPMPPTMNVAPTEEVVDGEVVNDENEEELSVLQDSGDFIIDFIAPFSISVEGGAGGGANSTLTFIVINKNKKLFTMSTTYQVETNEEIAHIEGIPFNTINCFSTVPVISNLIINELDNYISDLNITYNEDGYFNDDDEDLKGKYLFSLKAKKVSSDGFKEEEIFYMTSDTFSSINFVDRYVTDCINNNRELAVAAVAGKATDDPSELVFVDKIDRIIAMAPITETCSSVEFIALDKDGNKNTILAPFGLGKFNKKKFKGMTFDKIQNSYMLEADQYLHIYSNFCRFANIDKEYFAIKAKNKDNKNVIFFIDSTVRTELETLIGEF